VALRRTGIEHHLRAAGHSGHLQRQIKDVRFFVYATSEEMSANSRGCCFKNINRIAAAFGVPATRCRDGSLLQCRAAAETTIAVTGHRTPKTCASIFAVHGPEKPI